jgi:hypothetical protein
MQEEHWMTTGEFCKYYQVELSFVNELEEFGLIEFNREQENNYIEKDRLADLEKFIHMHYDLNINMEGIDAIHHLLERMKSLRSEIELLKNRLSAYE